MHVWGAKTPKRHVGWSNSSNVGVLHGGKLKFNYKDPNYQSYKTTKKTISKSGKKQFTGRKAQLRNSGYSWLSTHKYFHFFPVSGSWEVDVLHFFKTTKSKISIPQQISTIQGIIHTALDYISYGKCLF